MYGGEAECIAPIHGVMCYWDEVAPFDDFMAPLPVTTQTSLSVQKSTTECLHLLTPSRNPSRLHGNNNNIRVRS